MSLLTEKAYTLLHAGPLTTQELAANLGIARSSVSEILRPLRREGKIRVRRLQQAVREGQQHYAPTLRSNRRN